MSGCANTRVQYKQLWGSQKQSLVLGHKEQLSFVYESIFHLLLSNMCSHNRAVLKADDYCWKHWKYRVKIYCILLISLMQHD